MQDFIKTIRGWAEIEQRQLALNARQRQLLFLIDTPAFSQLSPPQQQRLATRELLDHLLNLKLITFKTEQNLLIAQQTQAAKRVYKKTLVDPIQTTKTQTLDTTAKTSPSRLKAVAVEFKILSFYDIQQLMIMSLNTHCGLMAKPLIEQIHQANSIQQLKSCQMQWITFLQESRMPAVLLLQTLQQINFAIKAIQ